MAGKIADLVRSSLREMLRTADLATETERSLRGKLEAELGVGLDPHKDLIKKEIEDFMVNGAVKDEVKDEGGGIGSGSGTSTLPIVASTAAKPEVKGGGGSDGGEGGGGDGGGLKAKGEVLKLSNGKRVVVDEFHGKKMVTIREFYEKNSQMLPGKKGISMVADQWDKLYSHINEINDALEAAGEDEKLVCNISKMRRVSVKSWKGSPLVNIREYYEKDGQELPGKKGISLTKDQFRALKSGAQKVDDTLKA